MVIDYFVRTNISRLDDGNYFVDPLFFEIGCFVLRSRNASWYFYVAGFEYPGIFTKLRRIMSKYGVLAICKI